MTDATNNTANSSAAADRQFFDFQARGLAYLNDIRLVHPKKGQKGKPFLAVRCKVLQGRRDEPTYVSVNCNVFGEKLKAQLMPYVGDKDSKILGRIEISDLALDTYEAKKGDKAGTIQPVLYARMYALRYLKVNDVVIDLDPETSEDADESQQIAA